MGKKHVHDGKRVSSCWSSLHICIRSHRHTPVLWILKWGGSVFSVSDFEMSLMSVFGARVPFASQKSHPR